MIVARYSELRTVSNYSDQVEYVKSIILKEGDRHTADCPFCGGKNKFTLDKFDGKLIWNCYRAVLKVHTLVKEISMQHDLILKVLQPNASKLNIKRYQP